MANSIRGEVGFTAGGAAYVLVLGANALCELEDALGRPMAELGEAMKTGGTQFTILRQVFWAALQDRHEGLSLTDAGRLMDAVGLIEAGRLISEALRLAFTENKGGSDAGHPRKPAPRNPKAGAGSRSSARGSARA